MAPDTWTLLGHRLAIQIHQFIKMIKSYSNMATFLLSWRHRYKNSTVVITIWLTVTKNPSLKWQWNCNFTRRCFLSSITGKILAGLVCIYEQHGGCLIRSRNSLPFADTRVHPSFADTLVHPWCFGSWGPCCTSFLVLCVCCPIMCL
jgi:hypothetical protein